jgi:hypothetical protein
MRQFRVFVGNFTTMVDNFTVTIIVGNFATMIGKFIAA